jgi:hypothetical protein
MADAVGVTGGWVIAIGDQAATVRRLSPASLVALPIDLASGNRVTDRRAGAFTEWFRVRNGQIADTQYNMVSQYEVASPDENYSYSSGYADGGERGYPYGGYRNYYGSGGSNPFAGFFGLFAPQQNYAPPQRPIYPPAARQQQYPSGYPRTLACCARHVRSCCDEIAC